jgi:acyl transferase domain-containing protein
MAGCVAVIGLGCVLPGAANADEAWTRWRAGSSAIRLPDPSVGFDPRPDLGGLGGAPLDLRGGYAVDRFEFDWRRYRTPPADAVATNAMQFLVLEAGTQALASVRRIPRERTAIFLGATGLGFQKDGGLRVRTNELMEALASTASVRRMPAKKREAFLRSARGVFEARLKPSSSDNSVGSLASVAAARIAMHHDLCGAHYAVDADHASALAALEIARSALLDGEWDCVVVGGASELLTPVEHVAYRAAGLLSPTGRIAPLADDADGTVLGEGAAMFALKRLEDAVRDEDPIYAILSAVRSATPEDARPPFDPGSAGITAAVAAAWGELGQSASTAQLFECSAPGFASADAAELSALTAQLAADAPPPVVDSAAFDMGHLRAASGAASLLRAILSLHHGRLLPSPRQQLRAELDGRRLRVIHDEEAWPAPSAGQPRRAGVTSVALSGQAFHAVLEGVERKRVAPHAQPSAWQPLAIVGVGGSYAGAGSAVELWTQLLAGADRVVEVPKTRWSLERYHSSDGRALDRTNAKMGSFVELPRLRPEDQTPATDAPQIDPTQLLVVRVAEEAVADAGGLRDARRTGAFIAYMPFQSRRFLADARVNARELGFALLEVVEDAGALVAELEAATGELFPAITAASLLGWLGSSTPTRLQRRFALGGPLIAVESACASTLAALHAAAQALRDRRCDTALVGGGYCDMSPEFYVATSRFNGLSPAGIYPFDASAQGFVPGEGAGVFVVKRLADAERDGDHIHAIVRGIGGSSDGRGRSVFTPSIEGESLALGRALGDVDAATVEYVECHGTGTPVGDATEVMSLAYSYGGARRSAPLRIGSVKSNLGHLIAAAGAPALTKSIFALEHGKIPASLHCAKPSGKIDFASARIEVVREAVDWPAPATHPRRAGVSAFGIGGSNFHVLLEEHRPTEHAQTPSGDLVPELFVFTGGDEAACRDALAGLAAILDEASNEDFSDAAQASRQQALASQDAMRLALVVVGAGDLARKAELVSSFTGTIRHAAPLEAQGVFLDDGKPAGDVVVLFPGQGSQYADMAHALARRFPLVDALLDRADTAWRGWTGRTLRTAMWPVGAAWLPLDEDLHAMVFVVSCAIHTVLQSFGVRPAYFLGQSAGELAALVAAEALSFEDGLRAILARTQSVLELPLADRGTMAAVAIDATALQKLLAGLPGVAVVAADNCPRSSLASGETAAMQALAQRCEAAGVELTPLAVSHAYHSAVIAGAASRYRAVLETLTWRAPKTPVLSTVDLSVYDADVSRSIDRLVRQYTTPVRFSEAVRRVYELGARLFLEAGPKWPLTSYVREVLAAKPCFAHAAMHPKVGEVPQLLRLVAGAYVRGAAGLEPSTSAPQPVSPAGSGATHFTRVRTALVSALATRTGYPEDMLELDLDLEGDLGIDTVKQVEVFAAVREGLGLAPEPGLRLRDLNTLRKVIDRFVARLDGTPVPPAPTRPPPARTSAPSDRFEEIRATVVTALAARTGYPEEMLELDLDLEGDLGIDTVKQVEIFGAVREGLGLALEPGVRMRDLNTLRKVIDRFVRRLEGEAHVQAPAAAARAPATEHDAARALDRERFPALARVRAQSADRLVATRTLSLETDRYLADAQLAGRRCVPSGMALEALAEAASLLLDAEVRTALDLKSAGPLLVGDRGECAIELEAVRVGEGRAQVTLYVLDAGSRRQVRFGGEFSASVAPAPATPRAVLRALDRRGQSRNGRALSGAQTGELHLGETIGGCVWARSLSFCEVIGGIRADDDRLFYGLDRPKLALGPALLECAFMLAGFGWYALAQAVGVPVDIEHIELGRAAEADEEVLCHVRLRGATSTTVTADLVLLGGDYQPIMSVRGCRLMQVDRMVDFSPEPDTATGSWAHFCRALKGVGGTR